MTETKFTPGAWAMSDPILIDYNMSADYCSDWTAIDAIREMVQNAIDSGADFSCEILQNTIRVTTYNRTLPLSSLMLGQSVKAEGSIGKYGEGYKIGMLVLTRDKLLPTITIKDYCIGGLLSSNAFHISTFKLKIIESQNDVQDIVFECRIGDIDVEELAHKIPYFTADHPEKPKTVDIWQDRPGEIYVNGLFVTKSDLVFGYNFAPSNIELNRDRNMVGGIYWQLAIFYVSLGVSKAELIFNLVERDAPDVQDLSYMLHSDELKAELVRLFYNKYGGGAKISKPGTSYFGGYGVISTGHAASRVYEKCGIPEAKKVQDPLDPCAILSDWREQNKSKMRRDLKVSFDQIITRSKGWSKART